MYTSCSFTPFGRPATMEERETEFDCECQSECGERERERCPEVCLAQEACLTLAVGVKVQNTAHSHHCLQRDDLIERHSEQLVMVEAARGWVVGLMRSEIVMTKSKPLTPTGKTRWLKRCVDKERLFCIRVEFFGRRGVLTRVYSAVGAAFV